MQKASTVRHAMLSGLLMCCSVNLSALTIEDIALRNNKIIELDQEITIAEKSKKLVEIKSSAIQPETIALPRSVSNRRDQTMAVVAVHGAPDRLIVDLQYGDMILQKKLGEVLPNDWQIATIGTDSVILRKKHHRKPDLILTLGIGIGLSMGSKSGDEGGSGQGAVPKLVHSTMPILAPADSSPDAALVFPYRAAAN